MWEWRHVSQPIVKYRVLARQKEEEEEDSRENYLPIWYRRSLWVVIERPCPIWLSSFGRRPILFWLPRVVKRSPSNRLQREKKNGKKRCDINGLGFSGRLDLHPPRAPPRAPAVSLFRSCREWEARRVAKLTSREKLCQLCPRWNAVTFLVDPLATHQLPLKPLARRLYLGYRVAAFRNSASGRDNGAKDIGRMQCTAFSQNLAGTQIHTETPVPHIQTFIDVTIWKYSSFFFFFFLFSPTPSCHGFLASHSVAVSVTSERGPSLSRVCSTDAFTGCWHSTRQIESIIT